MNRAPFCSVPRRKRGQFLPRDPAGRAEALKWMFWQAAGQGPISGQAFHFCRYAPDEEIGVYATIRHLKELRRLLGVLDRQLDGRRYLADEYSIADIASYPWTAVLENSAGVTHLARAPEFPHLDRWRRSLAARPHLVEAYRYVEDNYPGDRAQSRSGAVISMTTIAAKQQSLIWPV